MKIERLHFIFPSHPLKPRVVEEMYADQFEAVQTLGCTTSLCPDAVIQEGRPLQDVPAGSTVVYRGWMLNASEYGELVKAVEAESASMLTSQATYLAAHHLPNWYPLIAEYTPETVTFDESVDLAEELERLDWEGYFIKDYVKSLKTSVGSFINNPSQIATVIEEMKAFRGELEGGICVRRVEPLVPETEVRHFVVNTKAYAPDGRPCPDLVNDAAQRIPSPYFSIDTILREDGELRIVEVGDGQVSDLVGWSIDRFTAMWKESTGEAK